MVEPPLLVLEDPQLGDLAGQPLRCGAVVSTRHPQQDAEARPDLADHVLTDPHAGPRDPLYDGLQLRSRMRASYAALPGRSELASL